MDRYEMVKPENIEVYKKFIRAHPLIDPFGKRKPFVVKRASISDDDNNKIKVGKTAMLSKKLAQHYNKLNALVVDIPDFDDDDVKEENARLKKELKEAKNETESSELSVAEGESTPSEESSGGSASSDGGELSSGPVESEESKTDGKPRNRRRRKLSVE